MRILHDQTGLQDDGHRTGNTPISACRQDIIKNSTLIPMFPGPSYTMGVVETLYHLFKISVFNPELQLNIYISEIVGNIGTEIQRLYICFLVQLSDRTSMNTGRLPRFFGSVGTVQGDCLLDNKTATT